MLRNTLFVFAAAAVLISAAAPSVSASDPHPVDVFRDALEREDFSAASRATFAPIELLSPEAERRHEEQVGFHAKIIETFIRDLGVIQRFEKLEAEPDDVAWVTMVVQDESEAEELAEISLSEDVYLVEYAYYGPGYLKLKSLPVRVREFAFGIPDSGPESRRRIGKLVATLAMLLADAPPGTKADARRITNP